MRLASGHRGLGLQGMTPSAEIPECWGIHGLHQSGEREVLANRVRASKPNVQTEPKPLLGLEGGGIRIYRPLLPFSKASLIATCVFYNTRWVEDTTNQDATRTPRNAIRRLRRTRRLPLPFQSKELVQMAMRIHERAKDRNTRAENLLKACEVIIFDARSGRLVVRMHSRALSAGPIPEDHLEKHVIRAQHVVSRLLRRLVETVSPKENISFRSMGPAAKAMFPGIENPDLEVLDPGQESSSFTVGGVHFCRLISSSAEPAAGKIPSSRVRLDPKHIWVLTRQPYASNTDVPTISIPPRTSPQVASFPYPQLLPTPVPSRFPPSRTQLSRSSHWSPFHLWDGRYWIRLCNASPSPLLVRPFREKDLKLFRGSLSPERKRKFDDLLSVAAPGKLRWTLPVIAEESEMGKVLAVPTLGMVLEEVERVIRWEVRYKKIDLGKGKNDGFIVH